MGLHEQQENGKEEKKSPEEKDHANDEKVW